MNKLSLELLEGVNPMENLIGTMALESHRIGPLQPGSQCCIELLPDFQQHIDVYSALEHRNEESEQLRKD